MALALYSVVGYVLVRRGYVRDAVWGCAIVLAYTLFPDMDTKLEFLVHRGVTHTVWFTAAVGLVCVLAAASSLRGRSLRGTAVRAAWAFSLGALAVVAHLLADVITPWGVMPLYPLSDALYTFELVYANNAAANYAMFAAGTLVAVTAWLAARPRRPRPSLPLRVYRRLRGRPPTPE